MARLGRKLRAAGRPEAQLTAALANNRRLAQQYLALQELERKPLARELHDELGQYLSVIKLGAMGIRDDRRGERAAAQTRAAAIVENCNHIHGAVTSLIRELRPAGLAELALAAALEHCVQTWRTRLPSVTLRWSVTGDFTSLPEEIALTAYRRAQAALTNIAKHAAARHVDIHLGRTGTPGQPDNIVTVAVEDDAVGSAASQPTPGLGLIGIRERVEALWGELSIRSALGDGYQLTARIPVQSRNGSTS